MRALTASTSESATAPLTRPRIRASRRYGTTSPLRYPGGKAALAGLFGDIIASLSIDDPCYVEPYAGGAGAGVALLRKGLIDHLVINDIDPAVHAFWRVVVDHNDDFVEKIRTVPLSLDEWKRQRAIYRTGNPSDVMQLGFAFFYLNRTNRSGVLNAGVIGGQAQEGKYKIDARFNRDTLIDRVKALGVLADRITVSDLDGRTVIARYSDHNNVFMYIDPPYVQAGSLLYLNAFTSRDHKALARVVASVTKAHWLLTYDAAPLVEQLYHDRVCAHLAMNYSARYPGRAEELLVASPSVAAALQTCRAMAPADGVDIAVAG